MNLPELLSKNGKKTFSPFDRRSESGYRANGKRKHLRFFPFLRRLVDRNHFVFGARASASQAHKYKLKNEKREENICERILLWRRWTVSFAQVSAEKWKTSTINVMYGEWFQFIVQQHWQTRGGNVRLMSVCYTYCITPSYMIGCVGLYKYIFTEQRHYIHVCMNELRTLIWRNRVPLVVEVAKALIRIHIGDGNRWHSNRKLM